MTEEYWTLEAFENAGTKDITVGGKLVKIKALDPKLLIILFKDQDTELPVDGTPKALSTEEMLKNLEILDQVLLNGLVKPAVTKETLSYLGRFKNDIAKEIIAFSGLGDKAEEEIESFREEPDGSNG